MLVSKRTLLATVTGLVIGLSTVAIAQTERASEVSGSRDRGRGRSCYDRPQGPAAAQVQGQGERCPTRGGHEKGRP